MLLGGIATFRQKLHAIRAFLPKLGKTEFRGGLNTFVKHHYILTIKFLCCPTIESFPVTKHKKGSPHRRPISDVKVTICPDPNEGSPQPEAKVTGGGARDCGKSLDLGVGSVQKKSQLKSGKNPSKSQPTFGKVHTKLTKKH